MGIMETKTETTTLHLSFIISVLSIVPVPVQTGGNLGFRVLLTQGSNIVHCGYYL